ncbi:hypothetical protein MMP66_16830 [Acinetobacter dispersus]|uniref:hypothetical protein n=1 Tax=Acinetobacter dispersus TaxID=70348 RepID=UPI001F4B7199|nr:hypothetical protein [Acinetobacter dispersus]MCH7395918.1 hypothetical protein [Acinetobacter dispersus]
MKTIHCFLILGTVLTSGCATPMLTYQKTDKEGTLVKNTIRYPLEESKIILKNKDKISFNGEKPTLQLEEPFFQIKSIPSATNVLTAIPYENFKGKTELNIHLANDTRLIREIDSETLSYSVEVGKVAIDLVKFIISKFIDSQVGIISPVNPPSPLSPVGELEYGETDKTKCISFEKRELSFNIDLEKEKQEIIGHNDKKCITVKLGDLPKESLTDTSKIQYGIPTTNFLSSACRAISISVEQLPGIFYDYEGYIYDSRYLQGTQIPYRGKIVKDSSCGFRVEIPKKS